MLSVTFVKWGGSLITEKTGRYAVRTRVLTRLARELVQHWPAWRGRLVLGHGSGSFGHVAAHEAGIDSEEPHPAPEEALSRIQQAVSDLHRHVVLALREAGLPAFTFAPSSAYVSKKGTPSVFNAAPVARALSMGALPVTYGDVTLDTHKDIAICSTETVFRSLISALRDHEHTTDRVLWCGNTHGVYDAQGNTISTLSCERVHTMTRSMRAPDGTDVTGGMAHRLRTACALAENGIESLLLNGLEPGELSAALTGSPFQGTRVR
ncbi:MAG: isopentenyl phosphate kinase [Longimonas sp.]|uniref:isopentenyl phosphate kinase n=1 Tax=Longimonas sp. TaxID=2039626 RepID=UPI0033558855